MDNNKIGKFICTLRKSKGLTQQQLGDKLFVTDKAVSKWERGLSLPDITIIDALAQELGVDVSEILNGEKGKKENINIEEEINKAIKEIEDKKILKQQQLKKIITKYLIIVLSFLFFIGLILTLHYRKYHPNIIKEGDNNYILNYNLEKNGLDEIIKIMNKTENRENDKVNITNMNISLNKKGNIQQFGLSLDYYDDNLESTGHGYYRYENKKLIYSYTAKGECKTVLDCEVERSLVNKYNKSSNIEYINEKIKKIPFNKQIKLSRLDNYVVYFDNTYHFNETTAVFDFRDNKKQNALSLEDYKNGVGGYALEGTYFTILLSSSTSPTEKEIYKYVFDSVDGDKKVLDYNMETDYYINNGVLKFTRDYGNTWIETDASKEEINETLSFYRSLSLLPHSYTISTNELIPIAYFYGEKSKLKISVDNGKTWTSQEFILSNLEYPKAITKRVVRFVDQNFGYVTLGTDYSMGTGEEKALFITNDSGNSWEKIELPETCTSKTLVDLYMLDNKTGILALHNPESNEFPLLYQTTSGGESWTKMIYDTKEIPNNIQYLSTIENIVKESDGYEITFGQGDSGNIRTIFKTSDMITLKFVEQTTENIHTVG